MLYVVTPLFNPWGYAKIHENFNRFAARMTATPDVTLVVVECAFGDRPWAVTDADNRFHVRVRASSVLWIKENLINLGLQRIAHEAPGAQAVAWIDADVDFLDENWVPKCLAALDHYDVIQPWSEAIVLGPQAEFKGHVRSFLDHYVEGEPWRGYQTSYSLWHPGFAWAARADTMNRMGGLLDISVVGVGDLQMATGLVGRAQDCLKHEEIKPGKLPSYSAAVLSWQDRAEHVVRRNVGSTKGTLRHHWHGRQSNRQYESRHGIPLAHGYCPHRDLVRNAFGVYELAHHATGLRDGVRSMFKRRNDDANTTD